ncbi:hypothetical protein LFL96_12480 [Paraburkholderia sp. D15]|uniref:hypothetical protein n=1 Tax=Paraburkholderia sp. D15 TaxID=2880218 RepID=UPI0024787905|nr:hypothetical protein [Paraburkholderia sp. D15]WGS48606.1 hypothetical protein LFL96_12480 [Paraburkholderia sp. D15]
MIRSFLGVGDRGGDAVITEGLACVTCADPLPRVNIATLYMKTWCGACEREGFIAPTGPRWPGTGPNGQQWALSGDINICGCEPPPVFHAERNMRMVFTAEEVAVLTGGVVAVASSDILPTIGYDEQVQAVASAAAVVGYPYFIEASSDSFFSGRVDAHGLLPRICTDSDTTYTVYWGDEALSHKDWNHAE